MTFRNGSRIAASSACISAFIWGCNPYTPEIELWPPALDASSNAAITAFGSYDATSAVNTTAPPAPTSVTKVAEAGSAATEYGSGDAGPPAQIQVGMDASSTTVPGSGGNRVNEAGVGPDSAAHHAIDAGTPRAHALTVAVTTVDDGQGYSPANVGAIWIAESSGAFVKTLQEWGKARIDHIILWNQVTKAAGLSRNTVDAITSASAYTFGPYVVYWNFTDTSEKVVPDGTYRVYFETADFNVQGPNTFVEFTKGPTPSTLTFPDTPSFTNIELILSP
ncbi:MAG: DUF2271 domain-containing protein [Polyangiaceae bacterium]